MWQIYRNRSRNRKREVVKKNQTVVYLESCQVLAISCSFMLQLFYRSIYPSFIAKFISNPMPNVHSASSPEGFTFYMIFRPFLSLQIFSRYTFLSFLTIRYQNHGGSWSRSAKSCARRYARGERSLNERESVSSKPFTPLLSLPVSDTFTFSLFGN